MILTPTYFMDSGIPVSSDISESEVTLAIKTCEQFYVKPRLGADKYADIVENPTQYADIINGTDTLCGLKLMETHLVFAYMLYDMMRLTRYSSVVKRSDESEAPKRDDILALAKHHYEIAEAFMVEIAESLQIKIEPHYNNFIFGELL